MRRSRRRVDDLMSRPAWLAAFVTVLTVAVGGAAFGQALPRAFDLPLPLFSPDSAWNKRLQGVEVLPESARQILTLYRVLRGDTSTLHPAGQSPPTTWPFMNVNVDDFSIPIFQAGTGTRSVLVCDYDGVLGWTNPSLPIDQPGGPVTVLAPSGPVRPAGPQGAESDGHLVLYEPASFQVFDFWQATTARTGPCQSLGGGLIGPTIVEAGAIERFDVRGNGANAPTLSSARATGPPLLAGLIVPEDIERGVIAHALAVAIPALRNTNASDPTNPFPSDYFPPASTTESDFFSTDPLALAAGQRIRLRPTLVDADGQLLDEQQLAPISRMFLTALRVYGAFAVDNAGGFTFYAEDAYTADLGLSLDAVDTLIGAPPGAPLPPGHTKWQAVIERLNTDLGRIPLAYGPWVDGQDPSTAAITTANFDVVRSSSTGVPGAPRNLAVSVGGQVARFTWNPPTAVFSPPTHASPSSYALKAGVTPGAYPFVFPLGQVTSFEATGPDGRYVAVVAGVNAAGEGPPSNEVAFTLPGGDAPPCDTPPDAPTGLTSSVAESRVTLTWAASGGCRATSYVVQADVVPGGSALANVDVGNVLAFGVANVPSGLYFARVRGRNGSGDSAPSNEVSILVP